MQPSLDMARQFLQALDPEAPWFAFRTFSDRKEGSTLIRSLPKAGLEAGLTQLADLNKAGAGCFVTVSGTDGEGCAKANVTRARALFIDFDDAATAVDQVSKASGLLEPSMVVESSPGKFHLYWLTDGLPLERLEPWLRHLISQMGGDHKCKDMGRVLRLPGFLHQKGEPFLTRLVSCVGQRYTEAQLIESFGEPAMVASKPAPAPRLAQHKSGAGDVRMIQKGGRNAALVKEAGNLRRRGYGLDATYGALSALNQTQFEEPVPDSEVRAVAEWAMGFDPTPGADITEAQGADAWQSEINNAGRDAGACVAVARRLVLDPSLSMTETEALLKRCAQGAGVAVKVLRGDLCRIEGELDRPVVEVRKSDFAASVNSALRVLAAVPGLRQRGGELVEVVVQPDRAAIQPVSAARLAYLISSVARWRYGTEDGPPDASVLQAVMAAGAWPGVLPLSGLLVQPTVTATGDLICDDGHHADTHLEAVFDAAAFPPYVGTASAALTELRGLLAEFAFADDRDESAALAAILTAVVRPLLATAPAFMVQAGDYGTGKTFLGRLIAEFASGNSGALLSWPKRDEEQRKVLMSCLVEGRAVLFFDNIMTNWNSAALAAILTSPTYSDRLLGGNSMPPVSTRCLVLGTGNNVGAIADLSRRVLTIKLDARCERPWNRKFERDPLSTVQAERGKWVMLALFVLSDFLKAGTVPPLEPLASFGEWSRIVRGCLVHHGLPDPVAAVSRNSEDDEDRDLLDRVLWGWSQAFGSEAFTAKGLEQATRAMGREAAPLRSALEEIALERGEINLRRLGTWLRDNAGRVVDGRRLAAGEKTREGKAWHVANVTPMARE